MLFRSRRTGFQSFKRNVAIGLGNLPYSSEIVAVLSQNNEEHHDIVLEHQRWAFDRHVNRNLR